ncbi:MAG: hypothetical protein KKF50_04640 [Nanoarchaeota archaeon]|nr:hypothetical protein [Nanoarchaeota archaeon]
MKILKTNRINTYQRDPPPIEDSRFGKYIAKEIKFYRNLADYKTAKPTKEQKNGLENNIQ